MCEALTLKVMVSEGWTFRKRLGGEEVMKVRPL